VTHNNRERTRATRRLLLQVMLWGSVPGIVLAQTSPFMTGMTSLQANILSWLTPVAIILVMVLGGMAMASRIVENCGNTLILRCSGSDSGGTAHFASRLIGDRELLRQQTSQGRDREGLFAAFSQRRSTQTSVQQITEAAIMASELEQLPDLVGYFKTASARRWRRITLRH